MAPLSETRMDKKCRSFQRRGLSERTIILFSIVDKSADSDNSKTIKLDQSTKDLICTATL